MDTRQFEKASFLNVCVSTDIYLGLTLGNNQRNHKCGKIHGPPCRFIVWYQTEARAGPGAIRSDLSGAACNWN